MNIIVEILQLLQQAWHMSGWTGVSYLAAGMTLGGGCAWWHYRKVVHPPCPPVNEEMKEKAETLDRLRSQLPTNGRRIWARPISADGPQVIPQSDRRIQRIVSFFNLKGGVGKSTVTANLGAVLAEKFNKRVLLLDFDHQQSLTRLCMTDNDWDGFKLSPLSTASLFGDPAGNLDQAIPNILHPVPRGSGAGALHLAPAKMELAAAEDSLQARWQLDALEKGEDPRSRLGRALSTIYQQYDLIFIDCPPRFTLASVNALMISDVIIAPITDDDLSMDPIRHLVLELENMQATLHLKKGRCLGLLMNQKSNANPVAPQVWDTLTGPCHDSWRGRIKAFDAVLTDYVAYRDAAGNRSPHPRQFAINTGHATVRNQFENLAQEFLQFIL